MKFSPTSGLCQPLVSVQLTILALFCPIATLAAAQVEVVSPHSSVHGKVFASPGGNLMYTVQRDGETVVEPSPIGITCDGHDLGTEVTLGTPKFQQIHETYSVLGVKRTAHNDAVAATIPLASHGIAYTIDARAFDDAFAWRIIIPGQGTHHISGETSGWRLPAHSLVWYTERNNDWKLKSYAGEWLSADIDHLPVISSQGPIQAPPLVIQLPAAGFELISEAALANYSGMRLRAVGDRRLLVDFTEAERGFDVDGPVVTPWRVTVVSPDLNALVNTDVFQNLNPPPDPHLFSDTSYIRPGRSVWRYWSRQTGSPIQEREFVDYAAHLGFEYTLVDDGWDDWPDRWLNMKALCDYARTKHIGVFAWRDYRYLNSPVGNWAQLREFLDRARTAGLAGVKIDFINGESKDKVDFEIAALALAAERRLMVDFHGLQKPTGEARTYPNEISREAIRGLELNRMREGPVSASHNAALPFTRYVVGPGDYTPLGYTWPGSTTWAHQLATVIAFTSPFLTIAEDPQVLLSDQDTRAALDVLQAIPSTWDETEALPGSTIGHLSIIARRKGSTWFLSVLNGKETPIDLPRIDFSFLGTGKYNAVFITSPEKRSFHRVEVESFNAQSQFAAHLSGGDGLVGWFRATQ